MIVIGKAGSGNLLVEISLADLSRAFPDRRFVVKGWDSVQVERGSAASRTCTVCGCVLDGNISRRQTICDKPRCFDTRQRDYASRRKTPLAVKTPSQGKAPVDRAARLDAIRRVDERLTLAAMNGGQIQNLRDPAERRDPVEA